MNYHTSTHCNHVFLEFEGRKIQGTENIHKKDTYKWDNIYFGKEILIFILTPANSFWCITEFPAIL